MIVGDQDRGIGGVGSGRRRLMKIGKERVCGASAAERPVNFEVLRIIGVARERGAVQRGGKRRGGPRGAAGGAARKAQRTVLGRAGAHGAAPKRHSCPGLEVGVLRACRSV